MPDRNDGEVLAGAGIAQTGQQLQRLAELRQGAREYSQDLHALGKAGRDAGEILGKAFSRAAVQGKDLSSTLKETLLALSQHTLRRSVTSFQGALARGLSGVFGQLVRNANGNAFSGGRVIPLARGGVVSSPTTFPLSAGAAGVMGEAGPEAVMPLARGPDGRLGVRAESGGAQRQIHVNFNVTTPDAAGLLRSEAQIAAMLQRVAERGKRNL